MWTRTTSSLPTSGSGIWVDKTQWCWQFGEPGMGDDGGCDDAAVGADADEGDFMVSAIGL
jgi:hypothetical protein